MTTSTINDMNDPEFRRLLAQEELILEVTETICDLLENEKVSRKELADRLGKSKGFVSQLLNGGRNLTLRTVADILHGLGYKVTLAPHKELRQSQKDNVIEFKTRHTFNTGKFIKNWGPLERSVTKNYPEILTENYG
jgi:transcriptional regulator with XRE-family HTH domain